MPTNTSIGQPCNEDGDPLDLDCPRAGPEDLGPGAGPDRPYRSGVQGQLELDRTSRVGPGPALARPYFLQLAQYIAFV